MAETAGTTRERREFFLGEGTFPQGTAPQPTENLRVNIGPSHPAMHGVIRIFTELDGEKIVKAEVEIGYLHRASRSTARAGRTTTPCPTRTA